MEPITKTGAVFTIIQHYTRQEILPHCVTQYPHPPEISGCHSGRGLDFDTRHTMLVDRRLNRHEEPWHSSAICKVLVRLLETFCDGRSLPEPRASGQ